MATNELLQKCIEKDPLAWDEFIRVYSKVVKK